MLEQLEVRNVVELAEFAIREVAKLPESLTNVSIMEKTMANEILSQETSHVGRGYSALSENAEDKVNQQERSGMLRWLAAMFECEGTFTFQYNEQVDGGGLKSHIQPRVIFVNTDFKLVDAVDDGLRMFGFQAYRNDHIKGGLGKKKKAELQVNSMKSLPLLKLLRPFMIGDKSEVVDCLIAFIEYRLSRPKKARPYGEYEFSLLRRVREINSGHWRLKRKFSSISSETVRQRREQAWKAADVMIQSGLHGDMQNATETLASPPARTLERRRRVLSQSSR